LSNGVRFLRLTTRRHSRNVPNERRRVARSTVIRQTVERKPMVAVGHHRFNRITMFRKLPECFFRAFSRNVCPKNPALSLIENRDHPPRTPPTATMNVSSTRIYILRYRPRRARFQIAEHMKYTFAAVLRSEYV